MTGYAHFEPSYEGAHVPSRFATFHGLSALLLALTGCGTLYDSRTSSSATVTPFAAPTGSVSVTTSSSSGTTYSTVAYRTPAEAFFASLPTGDAARLVLCNPPLGQDDVVAHLCVPNPPSIYSLKDLQRALALDFNDATASGSNGGADGNPFYAITGHSSSLVVHSVSSINPRAIVCRDFGPIANAVANNLPNKNSFACMGFTRGENFVEVATTDASTGVLNFYVIKFETACSAAYTCTPGDLLTPADEQNWVGYNAYEDDPFFKNTIMDCRQCHQPNAQVDPILRMQENTAPYSHFFSKSTAGGKALLADFHAAHGTQEDYGPIPAALIDGADGAKLAAFLAQEKFTTQPNPYDSKTIEAEVDASSSGQPVSNSVPGTSRDWTKVFNNFKNGYAIAPPYHDIKVTDANKLASMTAAYMSYRAGTTAASALPDLREIFPDDPNLLAQMGLAAVPGQSASAIFTNVCSQCHNDNLDQNLSRAKFSVTKLLAGQLSSAEKAVAVQRLQKSSRDVLLMPPAQFRSLQPDEIKALVNYLEQP